MSIRYFLGRILLPVMGCAGAWAQQYTISTVAGIGSTPGYADGAATTVAMLQSPGGVALDSKGNLYIADALNHVVRMLSGGNVTTVAGDNTAGYAGDGAAATSAELAFPESVAFDSSGNLYIADTGNHVIRMVDPSGKISTVAGQGGQIGATGDNGPATGALLDYPGGVFIDSFNNILIADTGNSEIRRVAGGTITCVLGCGATGGAINFPDAVVVDASGTLYIADTGNYRIVKYSGITLTVLAGTGNAGFSGDGGPATSAQLNNPMGLAMDSAGFVYISDSFNARIRKLLQNGAIVTVAGDGCCGYSGDGGAATSAQLYFPHGLVVDGKGNIYVCDTANSVIRLLTPVYPAISAGGVANAASGSARLSPGSLATVYGNYFTSSTASAPAPLPTSLGGVSVTVNGVPSPILFANSTQINFQVPSSTQTGTANVAVSQSGGAGNTIAVPVVAAAPGLFLNANGTAVVQNYPSYSLNTPSNPIPAGGTIVAYLTGIGPVLPSVPDGAATPVSPNSNAALPCSATIGGTTAIVSFIGLTPGYVGLAQANIMVPSGLTSGSNPLVVTCNGQASNSAAIGVQ